MRLLVLGGTVFLGRAVARQAMAAGHEVVCAARGKSGDPVPGVRFVPVDRSRPDGYDELAGEKFDAVVDVSRQPSHVRGAVAALVDSVDHYVFVSTCSVYADHATVGQVAGSAPVVEPSDEDSDNRETYGPRKVACENHVLDGFGPARSFLCRAGLIAGPEDEIGRFEYWVRRIAAGGDVLVPGRPDNALQVVDVRDLADWLIDVAQRRVGGIFDGISPPMSWQAFVDQVAAGVGSPARFTWVDDQFLVDAEVAAWDGERSLPFWLPAGGELDGFMRRDVSTAVAAGLRCRPVADTARDTWAWLQGREPAEKPGLSREDEAELLARWRNG